MMENNALPNLEKHQRRKKHSNTLTLVMLALVVVIAIVLYIYWPKHLIKYYIAIVGLLVLNAFFVLFFVRHNQPHRRNDNHFRR